MPRPNFSSSLQPMILPASILCSPYHSGSFERLTEQIGGVCSIGLASQRVVIQRGTQTILKLL